MINYNKILETLDSLRFDLHSARLTNESQMIVDAMKVIKRLVQENERLEDELSAIKKDHAEHLRDIKNVAAEIRSLCKDAARHAEKINGH